MQQNDYGIEDVLLGKGVQVDRGRGQKNDQAEQDSLSQGSLQRGHQEMNPESPITPTTVTNANP